MKSISQKIEQLRRIKNKVNKKLIVIKAYSRYIDNYLEKLKNIDMGSDEATKLVNAISIFTLEIKKIWILY